jgi:hypothetical protein
MRLNRVLEGGVVLGIGLIFACLGEESLAFFNACVANPACYLSSSGLPFEEFFAILVVGTLVSMAGAVHFAAGLKLAARPSAFDVPP